MSKNLMRNIDLDDPNHVDWLYEWAKTADKELEELNRRLSGLDSQLKNGRHYLMGIAPDKLTVEDALDSFGFGRNGLGE